MLPFFVVAKKPDSLRTANHSEIYFNWDNDVFVFKDYYYSQGIHLFWTSPVLRKNPLNHVLLRLKDADYYYRLGMVQEMYTPKDIADTLLNVIDQPYAGTLFLRSELISINPETKLKLSSQFDLGLLGPLSGAQKAQEYVHDWLGSTPPGGWDFQIHNRPYINYNLNIEKGLLVVNGFEFIGNSRIRGGNIHNDIQIGTLLRFGKLNNYFNGLGLPNKSYKLKHDFQLFAFGGAALKAVAYNATLMGGIIPPESIHQFTFRDITNFVVNVHGGIHVSYKSFGAKGQLSWRSKEFEGGDVHGWGSISLIYRIR